MEADEIDAPPVAVVGVELGRVLIRQRPQLQKVGRARARPERFEPVVAHAAPSRLTASFSAASEVEKIVVGEFDRLVEHLVGDGAVGVEGRAEIVLSVGRAVMAPISLFHEVTPHGRDRKESPVRGRHGPGRVLTYRPPMSPASLTVD